MCYQKMTIHSPRRYLLNTLTKVPTINENNDYSSDKIKDNIKSDNRRSKESLTERNTNKEGGKGESVEVAEKVVKIIVNSKFEQIEGVITLEGTRLNMVKNLPSIKSIVIPDYNKSYIFGLLIGRDTIWCKEQYISANTRQINLICN